ncbi:MBL fold metallo-hydrolase [Pseudonocardia lutea]|jgi:flavorubredoxin|uniref:MBL fold metallo-hydrolase n=1 Tax=Pseudonocardia lutea TaxID=2172015 RepID=A0ABW1IB53_9PSEU
MAAPVVHDVRPYPIADETFLISWGIDAPPVGHFPVNSLVIRGREPTIVDTGAPLVRGEWLDAIFSVVEPADVRWIFLSHDDRDHAGNLLALLDACPRATLLTTWFAIGRMAEEWTTPMDRCRFVNDQEPVDIGDRVLVSVRPPVFDNPTTRGAYDPTTQVYWSVDTFATNTPHPILESDQLGDGDFRDGQLLGGRLVAPWHRYLDQSKWDRCVAAVQDLGVAVVAGCHTPVIRGPRVAEAFELTRRLPAVEPWREFDQHDLDGWMAEAGALAEPGAPAGP